MILNFINQNTCQKPNALFTTEPFQFGKHVPNTGSRGAREDDTHSSILNPLEPLNLTVTHSGPDSGTVVQMKKHQRVVLSGASVLRDEV